MNTESKLIKDSQELLGKLKAHEEQVFSTKLKTNERVLARVTDGIYREPVSALRELISNAFDADAENVFITTDAPRFKNIRIEDDGQGMSVETLVHVIHNIGGSLKRTSNGEFYGVTGSNGNYSPKGRRLIGKIGIGLFSVSQLSQNFQIITKRSGDNFRTVATVALQQYNEVDEREADQEYESGNVNIWKEKVEDLNSHGTTIVLNNIRVQARETLTDKRFWREFDINQNESQLKKTKPPTPKKYYIGRLENGKNAEEILHSINKDGVYQSLPWDEGTADDEKFLQMTKRVWDETLKSNQRPQIEKLFDHYFYMLWRLSLSIPTNYVNGDIFDTTDPDKYLCYHLSNLAKEQAKKFDFEPGKSIRETLEIEKTNDNEKFKVSVDNIVLKRPILFDDLPKTKGRINKPMVFFGKYSENFGGKAATLSAGELKFHAYLFWNNKIAPVEHRGVLIRVFNASGTLFDETFLDYQVQEINRLEQITCEIFIEKGFDSALNIDRESFNYSHPHAVLLTRWLHNSLRQLTNTQKSLASSARTEQKTQNLDLAIDGIKQIAQKVWDSNHESSLISRPSVDFVKENTQISINDGQEEDEEDGYTDYSLNREILNFKSNERTTQNEKHRMRILEEKLKAIATVLISYGIFDLVPVDKRDEMLRAIYEIVQVEGNDNA